MINIRIQTPEVQKLSPKITVVGVGGAGGNAVNNMIISNLEGCEFLVCNTDAQALEGSLCENRIQLGVNVTGGLGAGARPEVGEQSAHESLDEVMQYLEGANMAFITAGMGGGTGTGAAPVIAKAARDSGVLTVGVVTKPFHFEGSHRMKMAEAGILEMQDYVDTLIVIPNQNLFRIANEKTTFAEAFKMADTVLQSGVRGVTDLMVMPGLINLDFADIRSAMLEMGKAMMGTGEAEGDRRAIEAAEAAINNPLLDDVSMKGARGVIINVTGGSDMTLFEVDEACNRIRDEVDPNANIIFGSTFDSKLDGQMRVSVVATGIDIADAKTGTTTGGVKVTAVGKPQMQTQAPLTAKPPMERAKPQTEVAAQQVKPIQTQPSIPTRPLPLRASSLSMTAPISAPVVPEQKAEEPESADMFEQETFSAPPPAQPAYQPNIAKNTALRGQVYGDSFIPPKPMVPAPQMPAPTGYGPQIGVSGMGGQASQAEQSEQQGLVLRPPVPGQAAAAQRKQTPSLFERITGFRRDLSEGETHQGEAEATSGGEASSQGAFHSGLRAPQRAAAPQNPAQGSLNIDSPAAPPRQQTQSEDELDIPAFLRRQAN